MRKKNPQWTGAQIVVQTLIEQGVTDVFGYPGGTVLDLYDELYLHRDKLRHILTAHEQGAAHAADGYARATGKVGVVIATSGPGATNLVTGIATAMIDSVPMVALTGNVATSQIGRDSFQEINIYGITMPITKHNYFVTDVHELADTIREAFQIAKSGRPGPVLIDIPKDVQLAKCAFTPQGVVAPQPQKEVSQAEIDRAAALIQKAERPYIYVGGGAAACGLTEEILAFAERIDACIGCTLMGLSAVPHHCPRFLGMQGMHGRYASTMANRRADLVLGLGVRFSDRATGNTATYAPEATIIQLDADLSEINKNVPVALGLVGDLVENFKRIAAACAPAAHPDWMDEIAALRETERKLTQAAQTVCDLSPQRLMDVINDEKTDDTLIVTDVGQHQMWAAQCIDLEKARRFISSGGLGTMGYGMGAAIGAQIGDGSRAVLITGDGSFGMNLNELATAVTYQIPLVIVLFNNGALGMVRQLQELYYGRRYAETELARKTDFVKLAQAFGAKGERAATLEAFRAAFHAAMRHRGPTLIEVPIEKEEPVLPMLPPDGADGDIITTKEAFQ
ncbi:MAG: biosynthetic-type acetolactate synthase large subunit [Clostridia bacterium]|nr:biosynthetic-type acetolactate synthase large subunit [Clostridia bacterium]